MKHNNQEMPTAWSSTSPLDTCMEFRLTSLAWGAYPKGICISVWFEHLEGESVSQAGVEGTSLSQITASHVERQRVGEE